MKIKTQVLLILCCLSVSFINAQTNDQSEEIDCSLEMMQEDIRDEIKENLKNQLKDINDDLEDGDLTESEADLKKQNAAENSAENMENRLEIARLFFQYAQRNDIKKSDLCKYELPVSKENFEEWVCHAEENEDDDDDFNFDWPELDKRGEINSKTHSRMIIGVGFNNTFTEDDLFGDTNYKFGGSRYFEIGWEWSQRILNKADWFRFNYGFSFQFNGFKPEDDQIFEESGEQTQLQDFGQDLDKSKFRMTNLILPLHLEFSNSKKVIKDDGGITFREPSFKLGLGGFVGLNISNLQKLKYETNGNEFKLKERGDFNTEKFLYGLSTYIGFDDLQLFAQYNLNSVFENNPVEQNNFQIGLRIEIGE